MQALGSVGEDRGFTMLLKMKDFKMGVLQNPPGGGISVPLELAQKGV